MGRYCVNWVRFLILVSVDEDRSEPVRSSTLFPLDLVFARKPKAARSLLWFAAIQCLERVKDPAGLAPKGRFIAAEAIQREIGLIGQSQKAAGELDSFISFHSRVRFSSPKQGMNQVSRIR